MINVVRITLTLDEDVHDVARARAQQRGVSIGTVVSEMARSGLNKESALQDTNKRKTSGRRNGILLFPISSKAGRVTTAIVKAIEKEFD